MPRDRNARAQPTQRRRAQPTAPLPQEPVQPSLESPVPPPPRIRRGQRGRQDSQSGESFHFSNLSDASNDDEEELPGGLAVSPREHSPASIEPTAGSSAAPTRPASPDLLVLPPVRGPRRHYADDIPHFFNRGSKAQGTSTTCKHCK
jgi:hypothetical protein